MIAITDLLLPYKIVASLGSYLISVYRFLSQITSFSAQAMDVNSASAVDNAGVVSLLEDHVIAPPFKRNTLPLVDDKS